MGEGRDMMADCTRLTCVPAMTAAESSMRYLMFSYLWATPGLVHEGAEVVGGGRSGLSCTSITIMSPARTLKRIGQCSLPFADAISWSCTELHVNMQIESFLCTSSSVT